MPRASRICAQPGCPQIAQGNWCEQHKPAPWANSTRAQQRPIGWAKTRARVLRRDHDVCAYCGATATEVDHVVPVSRGGTHALGNLVASCRDCNAKKNIEQRRAVPGGTT